MRLRLQPAAVMQTMTDPEIDMSKTAKSKEAFRTISEVAESLGLAQHVLRFWESRFTQIKPLKRGGNRRYYRPEDIRLIAAIRALLHDEGYTIKGVQQLFKEQGVKATVDRALGEELGMDDDVDGLAIASDNTSSSKEDARSNAPMHASLTPQAHAAQSSVKLSPDNKRALKSLLGELRDLRQHFKAENQ